MKKLIAINGSPRRNGNTAQLLQEALRGAQDIGAETEIVHLYKLNFKGCTSCFACKLKSRPHGSCGMKEFAYREEHFPEDCAAAYEIGRALVAE